MNKSGKEIFDFEIKKYFQDKKISDLFQILMDKVCLVKPQNLIEFLVEEVKCFDKKTVIFCGQNLQDVDQLL